MAETDLKISAGPLMTGALGDIFRRPFLILLFLNMLVSLVTASLGAARTGVATWLLLAGVTVYVQIATVLAAGSSKPDPSGDAWMRAAFRARCFWRFVIVELLIFVMVGLGLFLVVIGALVIGAYVALSEQAVVLERLGIVQALSRGVDVSQGNRKAVGLIFAVMILLPNVALPLAYAVGLDDTALERSVASAITVVVSMAGTLALTRAFVNLGGRPSPAPADVKPRPSARSRRR
ncbi:MAG TPA: hypothetical protein VFF07_13775 [Actinomycetota bacterium]|nr:hypothetical protein [Actinomycetota bacterium]